MVGRLDLLGACHCVCVCVFVCVSAVRLPRLGLVDGASRVLYGPLKASTEILQKPSRVMGLPLADEEPNIVREGGGFDPRSRGEVKVVSYSLQWTAAGCHPNERVSVAFVEVPSGRVICGLFVAPLPPPPGFLKCCAMGFGSWRAAWDRTWQHMLGAMWEQSFGNPLTRSPVSRSPPARNCIAHSSAGSKPRVVGFGESSNGFYRSSETMTVLVSGVDPGSAAHFALELSLAAPGSQTRSTVVAHSSPGYHGSVSGYAGAGGAGGAGRARIVAFNVHVSELLSASGVRSREALSLQVALIGSPGLQRDGGLDWSQRVWRGGIGSLSPITIDCESFLLLVVETPLLLTCFIARLL